jgi:hypothetical protein
LKKALFSCCELGVSKFEGFSEWPTSKLGWRGDPAISPRLVESMRLSFARFNSR